MKEESFVDRPIYFRELARLVLHKWWLVAAFGAIFGVLAGVYVFFALPIYEAKVVFAQTPESGNASKSLGALGGQLDFLATLVGGGGLIAGSSNAEALATLKSRVLTAEFIEENKLLPVLFSDLWDPVADDWRDDLAESKKPTIEDAYILFDREIRFVDETDDGLFTLSIRWRDPGQAADWANRLVSKANQRLRADAIREANSSIAFLKGELGKTDIIEVRQAAFSVIEQQLQQIMFANVQQDFAFKVIDPAVEPEPDRYIYPQPILTVVAAIVLGCCISILLVLLGYRPDLS